MDELALSGVQLAAREVVARLQLRSGGRHGRPRVAAAMIASADGRATVEGRSVKLGHPEDRDLLRELRTAADAVLAGSGTLRAERYASLLDPGQRAHRVAEGLSEHPVVATVDRRGAMRAGDVPLFDEPGVPVRVYREPGAGAFGEAAAELQVVELQTVDFAALLTDLAQRDGVRGVSCEGGPGLLRELAAQDCLDDLLITVAPLLAAGDGPSILTGPAFAEPLALRLHDTYRADDHLFLHYTPIDA